TILRGGKEALNSNQIIARVMTEAGRQARAKFARRSSARSADAAGVESGLWPENAIQVVPTTDREAIKELLSLTQFVDLCIPRGGEGLIRAVAECSKVPVIKHYKGVCHVFVDRDADLKMAEEIVMNAKVQRPAVCNAMETLLVDKALAPAFLPRMAQKLQEKKVELRVDSTAQQLLKPQISN